MQNDRVSHVTILLITLKTYDIKNVKKEFDTLYLDLGEDRRDDRWLMVPRDKAEILWRNFNSGKLQIGFPEGQTEGQYKVIFRGNNLAYPISSVPTKKW